jgi:hypothetical protein
LLSSILVHTLVFTVYNSIFIKYTFYVVVLHFLLMSLFHNIVCIKW